MHESAPARKYIGLPEAVKIAPGRPSTNCLWRWCRRGVKARDGQRVRLEHVRVGGKLFTTCDWLEAFGRRLADADARYFALSEAAASAGADIGSEERTRPARRSLRRERYSEQRRREIEDAENELDREGIR
jgi:hypothetical protein